MHRVFLVTFIAAFVLHAETFTFTSCTEGTTTVSPCPQVPGRSVEATATASDNSFFGGTNPIPGGQAVWARHWQTSTPSRFGGSREHHHFPDRRRSGPC